jgi:RNA polymerase sigma-70 factor (ECF subfamily)
MSQNQQQLIDGLKAQNNEVVGAFVQLYSRPLFGVIVRYAQNPSDAEEVLQDTLLKVVQKIDTFREESELWPWMRRVAINNAIMWLRKHREQLSRSSQLEDTMLHYSSLGERSSPSCSRFLGPEEAYLNSELSRRIYEVILSLPFEYRVPLILRDIEGVSLREIASLLGLKESTTKTRIHRARLRVRDQLSRSNGKVVVRQSRALGIERKSEKDGEGI